MIDFILNVIQCIVLGFIICVFAIFPLIGLYLMSETARELVEDFQMWAFKRRIKYKLKHGKVTVLNDEFIPNNGLPIIKFKHPITPEEAAEIRKMIGERPKGFYNTIFEEVAAEHHVDPRDVVRSQKEQDAQDQETLDRATEYHNDLD